MLNLSNTIIINNKNTSDTIRNTTPSIQYDPSSSNSWSNVYLFNDFYSLDENQESVCLNSSREQMESVFQQAKNLTFENFLLNGNTSDSFTKDYYRNGFFLKVDSDSHICQRFINSSNSSKELVATNTRHYYSRFPIIAHPEYAPVNFLYRASKAFHKWKDNDGKYHISRYPKEFVNHFRKKVSLDSQSLSFFKTPQIDSTYKLFKFNPNARAHKVPPTLINSFDASTDSLAPFLSLSNFTDLDLPSKISFLEFENCSRGSKPVDHSFATRNCGRDNPNKYSLFVYSHKVPCVYLEDDVLVESEATYYGLATFTPISDFSKYKKFLAYYAEMFQMITSNEAAWLLNPERFKQILQERYSKYMKYWKTMPSWLSSLPSDQFKEVHKNSNYKAYSSSLNTTAINALGSLSLFANSKHYRAYSNISKTYDETKQKLENAQYTIRNNEKAKENYINTIRYNEQRIKDYQQMIENAKKEMAGLDVKFKESQMIVEQYVPLINSLEEQKNQTKQKYEEEINASIQSTTKNPNAFKFINNLKKSGIHIDSIKYKKGNQILDLNSDPSLLVEAKKSAISGNTNVILHSIDLRILKPVIIKVDYAEKGNSCKKVVAGPYVIQLTARELNIGLLTSNSIHGHNSGSIWVHPHTPSYSLNSIKSINNRMVRGCLGEASSPIWSAFQSADPKMAVYAAMTWVTSANSSDAWGRNWKHFPPVQNVEFDVDDNDALVEKKLFHKNLQSTELIIENFIPDTITPNTLSTDPNVTSFIETSIEAELNPPQPQPQTNNPVDPYQNFTEYVPFGSAQN